MGESTTCGRVEGEGDDSGFHLRLRGGPRVSTCYKLQRGALQRKLPSPGGRERLKLPSHLRAEAWRSWALCRCARSLGRGGLEKTLNLRCWDGADEIGCGRGVMRLSFKAAW